MVRSVNLKNHHLRYLFAIILWGCIGMGMTTGCTKWSYEPFKPVYLVNDKLVSSDEQISDELHRNIIQVFRFYKVPYREKKDGTILIPGSLASDKDTLWNYTTKANDRKWLESHR